MHKSMEIKVILYVENIQVTILHMHQIMMHVCGVFLCVPVQAGASLGGVGSVGVVLLVLGLSSFT